jgi:hypothetical protein
MAGYVIQWYAVYCYTNHQGQILTSFLTEEEAQDYLMKAIRDDNPDLPEDDEEALENFDGSYAIHGQFFYFRPEEIAQYELDDKRQQFWEDQRREPTEEEIAEWKERQAKGVAAFRERFGLPPR